MLKPRTVSFLFALLLGLTSLLSSCSKNDPTPASDTYADRPALVAGHTWRLDEIKHNSQTSSSGAGIKDRYTIAFRADGTYTQTLLDDNSIYNGTWMLMTNNTVLHFIDHKGADHQYTLTGLTAQELRYSWTNNENKLEEFIFSVQP